MVSNLFSIRFDDTSFPSAEVVVQDRDVAVREYLAGPENALLSHVLRTNFISTETAQPVLLFGPSGVGKSHLLRGMVERSGMLRPEAPFHLSNAADFCREFSTAVEVGALADVRQGFRDLPAVALDDIHRLADKPFAQRELLHLLDTWNDRDAMVLLTSSSSPNELPFAPALKSRLSGGTTIPIQRPGPATRSTFIQQFADELDVKLTEQVVACLAEINPASIPELRGLMLQLKQLSVEDARPIDVDMVARGIAQRTGSNVPSVRKIIKKVAAYYGLTVAELTGPSRRQTTVLARNTAIFLTRQLRKDSFEQIGRYFSGRDHSTVMHAFQKITKKRSDPLVHAAIVELTQQLGMQHHNL